MSVRHVKRNLIDPEAAGVTLYPEAQHVNNGDECERWFYANSNGQVLIREYVHRAIPAAGIFLGITYQRSVSRARFLVVYASRVRYSAESAQRVQSRDHGVQSAAIEMEFG